MAHAETVTAVFADRLAEAVERKRSQLVVGLDPVVGPAAGRAARRGPDRPTRPVADAVARFCKGIVDAVAPYAVAVKPQLAFFEALGSRGCAPSRRSATTRATPACS